METATLTELLRRHWGHEGFRPRQEDIVRAILAGRDVAVIMPTGGGKSLCYQLPAVALGRTCVVVSPLIALMQDQALHMERANIPSAFLNSTLDWPEQLSIRRRAESGQLRLLYLSPERLVRDDTLEWLRRLDLSFFAIDEAHCISEWGHEFRPEYRQLRVLREAFPEKPIAAFTASATRQVRHDILHQLGLRDPARFVVSFHRPNLRYLSRECTSRDQPALLLRALTSYPEGNVIVYAGTIKSVEETAEWLRGKGVPAVAYHGKMETAQRQANQDRWMSGECRVLVGTLAFGLGINKPDVRAVIHLAMPKSVEQYYQEAGRAGRDGQPADCALLWQKRDRALLAHFIQEIEDANERERAWQRYHAMRRYAESERCRHRAICLHFGETPKWEACGMCDACGSEPGWLHAALPAASEPKPRRKEKKGRAAKTEISGEIDSAARERLRAWRLRLAVEDGVPAYVILHDRTIDDICRARPSTSGELLSVPGMGPKRVERFGAQILSLLR
ncbi:MAG TPA: RecQ family ATP-dependent DNA helicase [Solibacterales bacterium]|nr:RecQ family ATP-dependent DNA helicase [Bryobacterales bacterium]